MINRKNQRIKSLWDNILSPGTKENREREAAETIGTANSRAITKEKVLVTLKEYTGPADPLDPAAPSTFKIPKLTILRAQRMLWDMGVKLSCAAA